MKCVEIKVTGKVTRVTNEQAQKLVDSGKAQFVPKKIWKETGRQRGLDYANIQ